MLFTGRCHCGNIRFEFATTHAPAALPLRACQCSFCRAHGALSVSDARGRVRFSIAERSLVRHYRFGLEITDMLICGRCGCYAAAVMDIEGQTCATLNANLFDLRAELTAMPVPVHYADETAEQRTARRRQNWTPAEFE